MATDPLEARQVRLGKNQALFRAVNEQIEHIAEEQTTAGPLSFLCECATPECGAYVELTHGEYNAIRRDPRHFFVLPDHIFPEVETIVDDRGRYVVVEKFGAGGRVVEAIDADSAANPSDDGRRLVPEPIDSVTVALNGHDVVLTWPARQLLMRRLQHVQETARLRASFDAVGAARPVELSGGQRTALLLTLEGWSLDLDGYELMPEELGELRGALITDLHGSE